MKRAAWVVSLVAAVLLLTAVPSLAGARGGRGHGRHGHGWHGRGWYGHGSHGHGYYRPRVYIGLGPAFWWGPGAAWYGPPPAYVYPRRVIVEQPAVYIQREPTPEPPPSYWYYCESAGGYYPSVPSCPEPWVKVLPRTE
jgi:hypothetical protein